VQLLHVARQVFAKCDEERPAAFCACRFLLVDLGLKALNVASDLFNFVQQVGTLFMRHRALIPGLGDLVSEFFGGGTSGRNSVPSGAEAQNGFYGLLLARLKSCPDASRDASGRFCWV